MLKMLKNKLILLTAALTLAVPTLIPLQATVDAQNANCTHLGNQITSGVNATTPGSSTVCGQSGYSITSGVSSLAAKVVNIFSIVVGAVSVIMIIYAGFRYVTSGGESGSVSSAKNTLIYAIIGLVVVVLAQLIVHFVLNTATNVGAASTGNSLP